MQCLYSGIKNYSCPKEGEKIPFNGSTNCENVVLLCGCVVLWGVYPRCPGVMGLLAQLLRWATAQLNTRTHRAIMGDYDYRCLC